MLLRRMRGFGAVAMRIRTASGVPQPVSRLSVALAEWSHTTGSDGAIRVLPVVTADES